MKYFVTFMTDYNTFVCCDCGTVVDEDDDEYSLEQINQIFYFDFNDETLIWHGNDHHDSTFTADGNLEYHKTWKQAVLTLWEAMDYNEFDDRKLIKDVLNNDFKDMKALLKMVSGAK